MGVANDKKVVRDATKMLLTALSNLLESQRERKFRRATKDKKGKPLPRRLFCREIKGIGESTVAYMETGRMLNLSFPQKIRIYLAAIRKKDDLRFLKSFHKIYVGIKAVDNVLKNI